MEEIKPSQAFWAVTKASKPRDIPLYPTQNLITEAIDDAEIAECLADSIETHALRFPPHDIAHISRIEKEEAEVIGIHKPGKPRDLPASYRPISLSGLGKLFEKFSNSRLSDHLLGKGLIIDEQFGFRPAHSCPQQVLRLVEYVSEGFETERSTVAVFFDVAKASIGWHAGMSALTRQDVLSEQEFLKAPPSAVPAYTNDVPRPSSSGVQLALFADDTALFYGNRNRST
ncbi:Probable RNA-directed DNA polymerase from transposon X-element [Eumeta japonica]|uniref:Probable RNA-directed DNA polymerase from transposon X-element n=1 Tax=Eumeta variegata TaxID=151549 RepID=A0A4C1YQT7_EUMVA|nr:Probable RNA-directed DNA polymerase from transposon X-element [Eumeta japonica]